MWLVLVQVWEQDLGLGDQFELHNGQRTENINLSLDIGNGKVEELISYNQLLEHLENAQDHDMGMDQDLYRFRTIIGHQGPLLLSDPDWKGSKYNVQVEWETGEITFEPLSIIAADDPVTCAAYAKENDLLALEGWHRFRSLAKKDKVLARAIKQNKIRQVRRSQTYMFGYLIPRNYMEAMQFDSENKNSKWYDAIKLEMESMLEYKVFKKWDKAILDKHKKVTNPPKGYHRIKVHLVFAVKFDGRHKARLVADGLLTPEPIENVYSGVVSLRNLRLVIFLGKLNRLELWGADIGNAYLEAFTDEKLYIVAGPEFQELEGHILIFPKVLYGLKSSGKRLAEVIHGILRDMKFLPSKADPCIWLRKAPNLRCYEYIAVSATLYTPKIQNSVHFQNLVSPEPSIFCYSGCFHHILHNILHNTGHRGPMIQQSFLQCLYSVKVDEIFLNDRIMFLSNHSPQLQRYALHNIQSNKAHLECICSMS